MAATKATTGVIADDAVGISQLSATGTASSSTFLRGDNAWAAAGGGKLVQMVSSVDGAVATGTTVFPVDDTIPQNTEGVEYMSLAITPTNASNKLVIQFTGSFAVNDTGGAGVGSALFQDSTAGALAATTHDSNGSHERYQHTIQHVMAAGTTSATTFKIRAGYVTSATVTFNGSNTSRQFGGVNASSLIIWEYEV
tara:strand:+ start:183 stop:770 length:588 start_codon:yes stop_codon:yes gene_type:complete